MPSRGKIASEAPRGCTTAGNVGFTTDYVFRGVSQTGGEATVQGGVDLTCGNFYVGVWGSGINFGNGTEIDLYGGYRTNFGRLGVDVGFIYYAYPGAPSAADLDFFEVKAALSGEIVKGGTLTGTVFFSPEFTANTGEAVTLEASYSHVLPKMGMFSPTLSATVGNVNFTDFDVDYTYWNVGVTLGFLEKWSLDLRYWDSDDNAVCNFFGECDGRFVGTVKYTF
jgi:uncharacterized protein (TIGR02001 family)